MRLRSAATPIALTAFFAASFFWIPDPSGRTRLDLLVARRTGACSRRSTPPTTSGSRVAILSCIFLTLAGFYLVAGSVRRDRERGVGAILAATPLSRRRVPRRKVRREPGVPPGRCGAGARRRSSRLLPVRDGSLSSAGVRGALSLSDPSRDGMGRLSRDPLRRDAGAPGARRPRRLVLRLYVRPRPRSGGARRRLREIFRRYSPPPVFDPAGFAAEQWLIRKTMPENVGDISTGHDHAHGAGRARSVERGAARLGLRRSARSESRARGRASRARDPGLRPLRSGPLAPRVPAAFRPRAPGASRGASG